MPTTTVVIAPLQRNEWTVPFQLMLEQTSNQCRQLKSATVFPIANNYPTSTSLKRMNTTTTNINSRQLTTTQRWGSSILLSSTPTLTQSSKSEAMTTVNCSRHKLSVPMSTDHCYPKHQCLHFNPIFHLVLKEAECHARMHERK